MTGPSGRSTSTASVGTPLDVNDRDQVIATLLLLGNAPGDPVGVLPAGPSAPPLTLSARPRYLLELHVSGTKHERWVWIGAWMLLLAALLAVLGGDSKLRLAREGTA